MKNIIKKNQVIIFTIALMLIAAGYMNYTMNTESILKTAALSDGEQYADLGDAKLVSSNTNIENTEANNIESKNENTENTNTANTNIQVTNANAVKNIDQYFSQSKLDRDNMYSQMIESYQKILNNTQISEDQKKIAQEEIKNINDRKNGIMISENLIKNKGFENVVIFLNDKSVDVVVKAQELKQEQIAQIQNIVQRELKAEVADIHISSKV